MHRPSVSLLIFFGILLSGCAGPLAITEMTSTPDQVDAGQMAFLSVTVSGPKDQVASVYASVREAPDMIFNLVNDGSNGDVTAGDNIWSLVLPVPIEAEPGAYHLDFTVRDVDRNLIGQKGAEPPSSNIVGTVVVTVR